MKRVIMVLAVALVVAAMMIATAATVFAAEHHPPKFTGGNPHETNACQGPNNQPNCPGPF